MQISARNTLKGRVKHIAPGAVNSGGDGGAARWGRSRLDHYQSLSRTVASHARDGVYAVVKASDVMIAAD